MAAKRHNLLKFWGGMGVRVWNEQFVDCNDFVDLQ